MAAQRPKAYPSHIDPSETLQSLDSSRSGLKKQTFASAEHRRGTLLHQTMSSGMEHPGTRLGNAAPEAIQRGTTGRERVAKVHICRWSDCGLSHWARSRVP